MTVAENPGVGAELGDGVEGSFESDPRPPLGSRGHMHGTSLLHKNWNCIMVIDWNHCRRSREAGRFGLPADAEHDRPSAGPARLPPPGPHAAAAAADEGLEDAETVQAPQSSSGARARRELPDMISAKFSDLLTSPLVCIWI